MTVSKKKAGKILIIAFLMLCVGYIYNEDSMLISRFLSDEEDNNNEEGTSSPKSCDGWCLDHSDPWDMKCTYKQCNGCSQCFNQEEDSNKKVEGGDESSSIDSSGASVVGYTVYTVCNGLTNQLLGHAANLALAVASGSSILLPDAFIVKSSDENVLASNENAVPLHEVIDTDHLLETLKALGVDAQVEPFHDVVARNSNSDPASCGWLQALGHSNAQIVRELLHSMRPSPSFASVVETIKGNIQSQIGGSSETLSHGVCLHHRDAALDWQEHCSRWGNINDGVFRGNCLNDRGLPLHELVKYRIPDKKPASWIYYIGDEDTSNKLTQDFDSIGLKLIHRHKDSLVSDEDIAKSIHLEGSVSTATHRDLFALVDFFTCTAIDSFIGNSVSSFSATQIAWRNGMSSSWYNSRSIPMADLFPVYNIPIVYTYTEKSQSGGHLLLKASILSVRGAFGETTDIHVLYHGTEDKQFLKWLDNHGVIVHNHEPAWADKIEEMRLNGDSARSHLFEHAGNYLGTWQRIDIPLFVDAEYILFVDYDTIIHSAFTMRDFGLDITPGAACSAEFVEELNKPMNMGVTLFNVPKLRETYDDFLQFIIDHVQNPVFKDSISDQGAYLEFYEGDNMRFLDKTFNVKPYWKEQAHFDHRRVVHYHGLKPAQILKILLDYPLDSFSAAVKGMAVHMREEENKSNVCLTMHDFSKFIVEDFGNLNEFCGAEFEEDADDGIRTCLKFWTTLAKEEESMAGSCMERIVAPLITEMRASTSWNFLNIK